MLQLFDAGTPTFLVYNVGSKHLEGRKQVHLLKFLLFFRYGDLL